MSQRDKRIEKQIKRDIDRDTETKGQRQRNRDRETGTEKRFRIFKII